MAGIKWNLVFEGLTALAVLGGGIYYFGRFSDQLEQIDKRVDALEGKAMPGTRLGDVCLKLLDVQWRSSEAADVERVEKQLDRFHCYDRMNASTSTNTVENELDQNAVQKLR
jgi:hypothetical protein